MAQWNSSGGGSSSGGGWQDPGAWQDAGAWQSWAEPTPTYGEAATSGKGLSPGPTHETSGKGLYPGLTYGEAATWGKGLYPGPTHGTRIAIPAPSQMELDRAWSDGFGKGYWKGCGDGWNQGAKGGKNAPPVVEPEEVPKKKKNNTGWMKKFKTRFSPADESKTPFFQVMIDKKAVWEAYPEEVQEELRTVREEANTRRATGTYNYEMDEDWRYRLHIFAEGSDEVVQAKIDHKCPELVGIQENEAGKERPIRIGPVGGGGQVSAD